MIPECPRVGSSRSRGCVQPSRAVPSRANGGLLSDIQTSISREPFTEHYTVIPGGELGRGKFAVVRKCVEKGTGHEYAAKFMRKRRKGQDCRTEIIHEIAVLELATASPRVVTLHQVYEMASEMVLVLEFAAGGEIFNQCVSEREDEAFSQEDVKRLMRQILEGVSFLHQNNIVHLDLKPQNILLTSSSPVGDIKIVDFGLSRRVSSHHELREIMGTPEFVAPEILNYEPISTATDMWSIGVLAYVMLTGFSPFLGEDKQETFLNISQLNVSYSAEELQQLDHSALAFMQTLLRKRPQDRASAEQCLQHPWLQASGPPGPLTEEEPPPEEPPPPSSASSSSASSPEPPSPTSEAEGGLEGGLAEELIVVAAYTLGQCRQSSGCPAQTQTLTGALTDTLTETLTGALTDTLTGALTGALTDRQKAVSKRFKFEEPFSALQEVPGEFIY
ncbi:serine/threonine-protein kinase 17A isoform 2-T2 [Menidia menidia]